MPITPRGRYPLTTRKESKPTKISYKGCPITTLPVFPTELRYFEKIKRLKRIKCPSFVIAADFDNLLHNVHFADRLLWKPDPSGRRIFQGIRR